MKKCYIKVIECKKVGYLSYNWFVPCLVRVDDKKDASWFYDANLENIKELWLQSHPSSNFKVEIVAAEKITGAMEDTIYAAKKFNSELQKVMDERYEALKKELDLPAELEEFLFDYVYNETEEIMFEEYLAKYGKKFEKYIA